MQFIGSLTGFVWIFGVCSLYAFDCISIILLAYAYVLLDSCGAPLCKTDSLIGYDVL